MLLSEDFLQSIGFDANSIHDANAWSKLTPGVLAASDDINILGLILDDLNVSFLLRATKAHEGAKMLAAPPVTVFDGEEATVSIHKQVNYISGYSEPNRASDKPEPKHDSFIKGLELQLTPKLTPDNKNIILDVDFELSEVIGFEKRMYKEKYPYKIPQIDVVSTKTHCLFPNGKTLLIGGQKIITEEDGRKMQKKLLVLMKAEKVDSESFEAPKLGDYGGYGGYGYGPPPGPGKSEYRYNPNRPAEPNQK